MNPTATAPAKKRIRLFQGLSKKDQKIVRHPMWENNPISFQVLGICSALAVTVQMQTTVVMCIAVTFVLCLSNVTVSLLRRYIPSEIRIIVQLIVISSLVIVADQVLKAYMFNISKQLSIFVGLIITNCIIMGRAEGFAMSNGPWQSFLDGLGNALGYSVFLCLVAVFRETLGSGTFFGVPIVPQAAYDAGYIDMGLMVLAPGAFFVLGLLIWLQKSIMLAKRGSH